ARRTWSAGWDAATSAPPGSTWPRTGSGGGACSIPPRSTRHCAASCGSGGRFPLHLLVEPRRVPAAHRIRLLPHQIHTIFSEPRIPLKETNRLGDRLIDARPWAIGSGIYILN